jgi:hypothetical protein
MAQNSEDFFDKGATRTYLYSSGEIFFQGPPTDFDHS